MLAKEKVEFVLASQLAENELADLHNMVRNYLYETKMNDRWLKRDLMESNFVVAKTGKKLAGFIYGRPNFDQILYIYTKPEFRRMGFAEKMVHALRRFAQRKLPSDVRQIKIWQPTIEVERMHSKMASRKKYELDSKTKKLSIKTSTTGRLPGYYDEFGKPAIPVKPTPKRIKPR